MSESKKKLVLTSLSGFLIGGIVVYALVGGFSGEGLQGRLSYKTMRSGSSYSNIKQPTKMAVKQTKTPSLSTSSTAACSLSNCDLMEKLNEVHEELGSSSWTLSSLAGQNGRTMDKLGYGTWTLDSLAVPVMSTHGFAKSTRNKLGYGTWTLDSVGSNAQNARNKLGYGSWTLDSDRKSVV